MSPGVACVLWCSCIFNDFRCCSMFQWILLGFLHLTSKYSILHTCGTDLDLDHDIF